MDRVKQVIVGASTDPHDPHGLQHAPATFVFQETPPLMQVHRTWEMASTGGDYNPAIGHWRWWCTECKALFCEEGEIAPSAIHHCSHDDCPHIQAAQAYLAEYPEEFGIARQVAERDIRRGIVELVNNPRYADLLGND